MLHGHRLARAAFGKTSFQLPNAWRLLRKLELSCSATPTQHLPHVHAHVSDLLDAHPHTTRNVTHPHAWPAAHAAHLLRSRLRSNSDDNQFIYLRKQRFGLRNRIGSRRALYEAALCANPTPISHRSCTFLCNNSDQPRPMHREPTPDQPRANLKSTSNQPRIDRRSTPSFFSRRGSITARCDLISSQRQRLTRRPPS